MKTKLFGIVALVATIGFSFATCGDGDDGNNPGGSNPTPIAISMVRINGGTFTMGSPESEPGRYSNETQHQVTLSGFSISKHPVTQGQYETVMGTNPSYFQASTSANYTGTVNHPVEQVTWYDAIEFCNKLSAKEGLTSVYTISDRIPATGYPITSATVTPNWSVNGYRLPTEAQWEYACRAGTTTAFNNGNNDYTNDTQVGAVAWYANNIGSNGMHGVGLKTPNAWGLYDMHGNVWEWCWDWYGSYASEAQTNPTGAVSGNNRVKRGGSWNNSGRYLRSAYRDDDYPNFRILIIGFRLVRP